MSEFVSVLDIMENAPYGAQTAVRDEVAAMDADLRRAMDKGLTPEDMPVVADCIDKIATDYEANRESVLATVAELVKKHPIYE